MKKVLTTFRSQGYEFAKERLAASGSGYFICYGERDIDEGFYTAQSAILRFPRG
jgi:hypothetical protein